MQARLNKKELEELYRSMSNFDLAKKLNISRTTLHNYIKKSGIELKGHGGGMIKLKSRSKYLIEE